METLVTASPNINKFLLTTNRFQLWFYEAGYLDLQQRSRACETIKKQILNANHEQNCVGMFAGMFTSGRD